MFRIKKSLIFFVIIVITTWSCAKKENNSQTLQKKKIGVLIVSHGSHSEQWRQMLLAIEDSVKSTILKNPDISTVRSAFMEYNEPSIATRMKEFDKEGFTDVVVVPAFLTVSNHSFDDIPNIVGLKEIPLGIENLKKEKIEVYKAKANVVITPLLDFPKILGDNLVRRVKKISTDPENEACVLVAYGDEKYMEEWTNMMKRMENDIQAATGINKFGYAWCGHLVHYKTEPTTTAIEEVLKSKKKALVVPVLVAIDEMFQVKIIGGAIDNVKEKQRVTYKPDAILPDQNVQDWIIDISNKTVAEILNKK